MSRRVRQPNWYWDSEFPQGYPWEIPVEGKLQYPCLARVDASSIPNELVSFDNRRSALDPAKTGIHFFKDDHKLQGLLANPLSYVGRFADFGSIVTPDFTITKEMPEWAAKRRIWASRAIGAVYQSRGFVVFPTVRWNSYLDYEMATAGLPRDSAIVVSNYASMQDPNAQAEFLRGLEHVLCELMPHTVLVYGSKMKELDSYENSMTLIVHFQANAHLHSKVVDGLDCQDEEYGGIF